MVFSESDHRGVFVDIDYKAELLMEVEEAHERPGRRLTAKNKKWTGVYLKDFKERLEKCNIYQRVEKLWNTIERGKITSKQRAEFENLDRYITESMLAAERKIPKKHKRGWSPAVSRSADDTVLTSSEKAGQRLQYRSTGDPSPTKESGYGV